MKERVILQPKFSGTRFKKNTLPVELLNELHVLEQLIIDIAKCQYKQDSDLKSQRLPRHFTRHLSLHIKTVDPGSAIVPMLLLGANLLIETESELAVMAASERVVAGYEAFVMGQDPSKHIPPQFLRRFSQVGSRLRGTESIQLSDTAVITREVHRNLRLKYASHSGYNEEAEVRGRVHTVTDSGSQPHFEVETAKGTKVSIPLNDDHRVKVCNAYRDHEKVEVRGLGRYNDSDDVIRITEVDDVTILDPRDIAARIDELACLEDGWFDGRGAALPKDKLADLRDLFETFYYEDLPLPFLFPTETGGVRAEWTIGSWESSLDIDLSVMSGYWHTWNTETDEDHDLSLKLLDDGDWEQLREALLASGAGEIGQVADGSLNRASPPSIPDGG